MTKAFSRTRENRRPSAHAANALKDGRLSTPASTVIVRQEELAIPTYLPAAPDKNPMFLEKRVYQGSSGKVYPLPFTDRIAEQPVDRKWRAVWLENEYLRVLVLPELGGRIHAIQDKTNGYDLIYNQPVIKPALVGLAGPWASGGIEFNWPQHHRPATFLPVDYAIEEHADGSKTIWCGDHDPMCRMKGMHGVCLHPGQAIVELKVRVYNRTLLAQTFLWWANVATRVHEGYQSFFPPDVNYVADHARRSMSSYPLASGRYYGVNYGQRAGQGIPAAEVPGQFVPPHCRAPARMAAAAATIPDYAPNDLSFYANIPVPTSYMCMGSREDFFGGYDYKAKAGIVHIANHHISPGKKQWTWGNHDFGYAWDRNLTVADANGEFPPYIEIMSGVFTDNQPDFSFLQPGETKTWSQYWYPIQKIGPAQHANLDAALILKIRDGQIHAGVCVTRLLAAARVVLTARGQELFAEVADLSPGVPFLKAIKPLPTVGETDLRLSVTAAGGGEIIAYQPARRVSGRVPPPATEPAAPADMASADELFVTGLHLHQYRHATRCPTLYWREALRRDPDDARCNNALGLWHLQRGEFSAAELCFRRAIARLTLRNANPADGEPLYHLGCCLRHLGRDDEAYDAFYKSVWNQAWQGAGYHALAELDCKKSHWLAAADHLERSLRLNTDNLRARNLLVMVLRKLERSVAAAQLLDENLALDRLDWWTRSLAGEPLQCDAQTLLDIAHDLARAGFYPEAIALLKNIPAPARDLPDQSWGAAPLVAYTLGWLHEKQGDAAAAMVHYQHAETLPPDYCFPARLEEQAVLTSAMQAQPQGARAPYYLGNLLYDVRRHAAAIRLWERAAGLDSNFSIVWRNLGIGYFNVRHQGGKARKAYDRAFQANPADARLLFERDQLWKRLGDSPAKRLRELEKHPELVARRDDLSVEMCTLLNQCGRPAEARQRLDGRRFQPWEGGEGGPLGQHVRTQLALGRAALACRDFPGALSHFEQAFAVPPNLGEARHVLANQSELHYWTGVACAGLGDQARARRHWLQAANFKGDFQEMRVRAFSEMTVYSALSLQKLGQKARAKKLLRNLLDYARRLEQVEARIDYFATSLPTMLLFEDDLTVRQQTTALFLQAQAWQGLGRPQKARALLEKVLQRDPNHTLALEWRQMPLDDSAIK
jgi:tetratricopeptide (TPR) repeat protein